MNFKAEASNELNNVSSRQFADRFEMIQKSTLEVKEGANTVEK